MPSGQSVEIAMNEKYWYLKKCPVFTQLSAQQIEAVEQECYCREFRRGEVVYLPRDMADSVMLLARGRVQLYHVTGEGKQAILGFVEPGELFGELSAFSGSQREEHAEAMETTLVVLVPGRVMQRDGGMPQCLHENDSVVWCAAATRGTPTEVTAVSVQS